MSIKNYIPELWNVAMMDDFRKAHVFGKVCRCKIDAPITKRGQTVHITGIGAIAIGDYDGTDITLQSLDDAGVVLKIDQAKYFAFTVDDVDALQANGDLMGEATRKATYTLKDTADSRIKTVMAAGAGLSVVNDDGALDVTQVISCVAEMALALDEKDVPEEEQWIIVPKWVNTKLLLAGVYHANDLKGNINGFVTGVLGIDMYKSSNCTTTQPIAGAYGAVAYAEQIIETIAYSPEARFSDALKGLHVYGIKVVKPNALVLGDWTETADTVL
jgi:hypothetical protein